MPNSPSLDIERVFTSPDQDVYKTVEWETRDAEIRNDAEDGFVFQQKGVEFPKSWSQRATNIVASKYFYGSGDNRESSLKELIERVVNKIHDHGWEHSYFTSKYEAATFADELRYILLHQIASFNSPVWFNIGVEGVAQQASACYINHVEDDMESILELAKTEGLIFKRGSGAGVNISSLRGKGEPLSGGGEASGPVSFMKALDAQAGVIKSGGVTRRAAKMVVMDADHPDVEDFIWCKIDEERKAKALIAAGYDSRLDGEAYGTVAFQNANHSVRFTDEDMEAASEEGSWKDHVMDAICRAAWECGDPGIQFTDAINAWHTCSNTGPITASNPCSEFVFLDNTSCNLASINLVALSNKASGAVPMAFLQHVVRVLITAMEILCDLAEYPTEEITKMTKATRPLGLGFANLGAYLMRNGLPYDSEDARNLAAALMAIITGEAYIQSGILAEIKGPFDLWEDNRLKMASVMRAHRESALELAGKLSDKDLTRLVVEVWDNAYDYRNLGYRNAQTTVLAPTGTISFMMDCESTGIEPLLAPTQYKTLVGGGVMEIVPECYKIAREDIGHQYGGLPDFTDDGMDPVLATSIGDNQIAPTGHLKMVAAVQPFVSGAISKTINLPHDATPDQIRMIYSIAFARGVKCVSVYRDGSKSSQPISDKRAGGSEPDEKSKKWIDAPQGSGPTRTELPRTREAMIHKFKIGGHSGYIAVGLYENRQPGEVFVTMSKEGSTISGLLDAWAINLSVMLQYGIPLDVIVKKHRHARFEPSGFTGNSDIPSATSVTDYVVQWLDQTFAVKKATPRYIEDVEVEFDPANTVEIKPDPSQSFLAVGICPTCGGVMTPNGNCYACTQCGNTTGCG